MSLASAQAPARPAAFFDDEALIRECLQGSEEAWGNLIDKYKNLIFSIPVKVGLSQDDASEVFQMVCAELVKQLPNLRKPRALPQWLIKVATHESFRTVSRNRRFVEVDVDVEPAAADVVAMRFADENAAGDDTWPVGLEFFGAMPDITLEPVAFFEVAEGHFDMVHTSLRSTNDASGQQPGLALSLLTVDPGSVRLQADSDATWRLCANSCDSSR